MKTEPVGHPPMSTGEKGVLTLKRGQGDANGSHCVFRYLVGWCSAPYAVRSEDQTGSSGGQGRKRPTLSSLRSASESVVDT